MKNWTKYLSLALILASCAPATDGGTGNGGTDGPVLSSENRILSFGFVVPAAQGVIGESTVDVVVPNEFAAEVSSLTPLFTLSPKATASVNDQPLVVGASNLDCTDPVTVKVRAEDGSVRNYTLTVTVAPPEASGENHLASLEVESASLNPAFDSDTEGYTTLVAASRTSVRFLATLVDSSAHVSLNFGALTPGVWSSAKTIAVGANLFSLTVTAENGDQRTYLVTVQRPNGNGSVEVDLDPDLSPLTVSLQGASSVVLPGAQLTLTASANLNGTTLSWYKGAEQVQSGGASLQITAPATAGKTTTVTVVAQIGDKLASGSLTFLTGTPSDDGEADVTVDTGHLAPPTVSLQLNPTVPSAGQSIQISGTTSRAVSSYQWYLDGQALAGATSATYSRPAGLSAGSHRFDLIVQVDGFIASAALTVSVQP